MFFILCWSRVDEQCSVSLRCPVTKFHYTYTSIYFQILYSFKLLQNTWQSSLCCIVSTCWLSILNIVMCTSQSSTLIGWAMIKRLFAIVWDTDTTGKVMVDMVRSGLTVRIFLKPTPDDDDLSIVCVPSRSFIWLFVTSWTVAYQAPLSMWLSRQEYWSGLPCPPPGELPNPGTEPRSPTWQVDSLPSEPPVKPKVKPRWLWFKNSKIPEKQGRHQDHLKVLIWGDERGRAIHWDGKAWRTTFWISEGESRIKNVLCLRCLVHIQVEMLNRQLDVTIWVQLRSLD